MHRTIFYALICLGMPGILPAQRSVDMARRYVRLICLAHLKDAGSAGQECSRVRDGGMAVARAAQEGPVAAAAKRRSAAAPQPRSAAAIGRTLSVKQPDATSTTTYAYSGNQTTVTDPAQLLQTSASSWKLGAGGISGNPDTIDVGSAGNNYGSNVVLLMDCFQ